MFNNGMLVVKQEKTAFLHMGRRCEKSPIAGVRTSNLSLRTFGTNRLHHTTLHKRATCESEACAHYVMVSKLQWKPFWLATQRDPQNDWTATQNRVNCDVFAQAALHSCIELRPLVEKEHQRTPSWTKFFNTWHAFEPVYKIPCGVFSLVMHSREEQIL